MALVLALDKNGIPMDWISVESAITYHVKGLVAWQLGDFEFSLNGGIQRATGERSIVSTNSIIAVKGESKGKSFVNRVPTLCNDALFRRDRHLCAYCGKKFPDSQLTRDHVVPRRAGGKDIWTNVVSACKKCNNIKGHTLLGSPRCKVKLLYVPYTPNMAEDLILKNRKILQDQMDFLMQYVPENSRIFND